MEEVKKIISIKERIAKKNVELIVTENFEVGIIIPDEATYISTGITPYQLGAFVLEIMAGLARNGDRLEDKNAIMVNEKREKQAAFINIVRGAGIVNRKEFLLWHTPAVINCSSIDGDNDVSYRLTAIQAMDFVSQVKNISIMPKMNLISGMLKVFRDEKDKLAIKLKRSEVVYLDEEDKAIFLRTLERWLSGQFCFDRKKMEQDLAQNNGNGNENARSSLLTGKIATTNTNSNGNIRMYYTTRFNRKNLLFTGSPNPKIKINEQFMVMSYSDVAELFLLLYNAA